MSNIKEVDPNVNHSPAGQDLQPRDRHRGTNLPFKMECLMTSVEAMNLAVESVQIDQVDFARRATNAEINRRWSAQLQLLSSVFVEIDEQVRDLYQDFMNTP